MYVCACHGFTEKQVNQAVSEGPCSVAEVYRRLGETPQCGKCVCSVVDLVRGARGVDETASGSQAYA
jgi:bacterioferritin-associated ferredoxin